MPMPIRFDVRYGRANPTPGTPPRAARAGLQPGGPNSGYVVETDDNRLATVRVFDDLATLEDANQATHAAQDAIVQEFTITTSEDQSFSALPASRESSLLARLAPGPEGCKEVVGVLIRGFDCLSFACGLFGGLHLLEQLLHLAPRRDCLVMPLDVVLGGEPENQVAQPESRRRSQHALG